MLYCEMEVMEAIDVMLMNDTELMAEIEAEILTEAEADEFINWLYNDDEDNDIIDISKSELWKLCNSNIDCNFSNLNLTVYDNEENIAFKGIAMDYPYDWYDCNIDDYSIYNIEDKVYLDVFAHFFTWK